MSRPILPAMLVAAICSSGVFASDAGAQVPRDPVTAAPAAPLPDGPAFRDPKTGQIWTPENVGKDTKPVSPEDRAFNPSGQTVKSGQRVDESPQTRHVGTVPITAGPTVPLVAVDNLSLHVQPGGRWQAVLYLQNNSGSALAPVLGCGFTNAGNLVQDTRVTLPMVAGGERVGFVVTGPASEVFVDSVSCNVVSP